MHQYLRAHPDLTVVELGFDEPEIAAELAQICRSYRIVDVVDRRRNATLPDNVPLTKADLNVLANGHAVMGQWRPCRADGVLRSSKTPIGAVKEMTRAALKGMLISPSNN